MSGLDQNVKPKVAGLLCLEVMEILSWINLQSPGCHDIVLHKSYRGHSPRDSLRDESLGETGFPFS